MTRAESLVLPVTLIKGVVQIHSIANTSIPKTTAESHPDLQVMSRNMYIDGNGTVEHK